MKSLWQKEKLLILSNFSFLSRCIQEASVADGAKFVYSWEREGLNIFGRLISFFPLPGFIIHGRERFRDPWSCTQWQYNDRQ